MVAMAVALLKSLWRSAEAWGWGTYPSKEALTRSSNPLIFENLSLSWNFSIEGIERTDLVLNLCSELLVKLTLLK